MLLKIFLFVLVISIEPVLSEPGNILEYIPCERGWYYWGEKCYKAFGEKLQSRVSWEKARENCRRFGGDLASIESQQEQDFVTTFLQFKLKFWIWIGLNDIDKEGDFKWSDGTVLNYTNWKPGGGEPYGVKSTDENCVHMWFEPENDLTGTWNDRWCGRTESYICEMKPNPKKRSPNPMYCSSEGTIGWEWENSCYLVVKETKSWLDAERHCKNYLNGHLVSILNRLEDVFLDYILADTNEEMWIGIKMKGGLQQKWTSGWFVSYDRFIKDTHFIDGTCVARKNRNEWISIPCAIRLQFVCKVSKENPLVLSPPVVGSHCPVEFDGWRDLGGEYCYYFETEKAYNFYESSFQCKRRGGNLVSLHSKEENDMIVSFVKCSRLGRSFWIGLLRAFPQEDEFVWNDGSAVNYLNWEFNQPDNADNTETCVELFTFLSYEIGTWNDIGCENKRGYICSVKKVLPNLPLEGDSCKNFCISPSSYLYEIVKQSGDAKEVP